MTQWAELATTICKSCKPMETDVISIIMHRSRVNRLVALGPALYSYSGPQQRRVAAGIFSSMRLGAAVGVFKCCLQYGTVRRNTWTGVGRVASERFKFTQLPISRQLAYIGPAYIGTSFQKAANSQNRPPPLIAKC